MQEKHIYPIFDQLLSREDRERRLQQQSCVFWLTGLSGSGKSTVARMLEQILFFEGFFAQVLDGDNIRSGLNADLSFSSDDRLENIRRIAEVAKLYLNSGIIAICSFISPLSDMRILAKSIIGEKDFVEVFIDTPIEICESRDVKGLYKKARAGEITGFTGIDAPYEKPETPTLRISTANQSVQESAQTILTYYQKRIGQHQ